MSNRYGDIYNYVLVISLHVFEILIIQLKPVAILDKRDVINDITISIRDISNPNLAIETNIKIKHYDKDCVKK